MATLLRDVNTAQRNVAYNSVHSLQKRCLEVLAPPVTKHDPPKVEKSENASRTDKKEPSKPEKIVPETKREGSSNRSGRPPSRRIQRPTSIRRPKLIGKSVEGAAVQAMAASRARASVTRGSSPYQKTTKAVPSKEVPAPVPKRSASSLSRVGSREEGEQLVAQSNQDQNAELSVLLKQYMAAMSLSSSSPPFHRSRIMREFVDKYWVVKPERPLSSSVQNFLLTRSVHLWSSACVPFGFPDHMMKDVSGYFAQWLKMTNPQVSLLQLDVPSKSDSVLSPSSTMIVELKTIKQRKLCVVLQTSLKYKVGNSEPILRCEAWMLMLNAAGETDKPARPKRKRTRLVKRAEREVTLVDKKVCSFAVSFR